MRDVSLLAGLVVAASACSDSAPACVRNDDCASQFCRADGTCAPIGPDGSPPDAPGSDSGPDGATACLANHDGVVTAAELPMTPPTSASYRAAQNVSVNTRGEVGAGGARTWDLAGTLPGDGNVTFGLAAPTASDWWLADFPSATYASRLGLATDWLGIFAANAERVSLLGVVSPTGGLTRTQLTYDPPIDFVRLPLSANSAWTQTTSVSGLINGVWSIYQETYDLRVDAHGTMTTPYGTFPVLRLASDMERTVGLFVTGTKSFAWLSECFGAVANVASTTDEIQAEFSEAAEVRRLTP